MQPLFLTVSSDSRHADIVRRTESAIAELQIMGEKISFYAVADKAQVSRSTLYRCDDLRQLVEEARAGAVSSHLEFAKQNDRVAELERDLARALRERDEAMCAARYAPSIRYAYSQASEVA